MILTEVEAKRRWCPHTRVALSQGMAANRTGAKESGLHPNCSGYANVYAETRCLGSDCMMWDWLDLDRLASDRRGRCGLISSMGLES